MGGEFEEPHNRLGLENEKHDHIQLKTSGPSWCLTLDADQKMEEEKDDLYNLNFSIKQYGFSFSRIFLHQLLIGLKSNL